MKRITPMLVVAVLTACGPSEAPKQANVPTVEELAADPARLKELRQQCKIDRATLGEVLCNRVAEATRKRFYGDGTTPHTTGNTTEVLITSPSQKLFFFANTPQCARACGVLLGSTQPETMLFHHLASDNSL